jgi:hypothetical protein
MISICRAPIGDEVEEQSARLQGRGRGELAELGRERRRDEVPVATE